MRIIRKQLVKRCLDMMTDLAGKGEEEYEKFWSQFGRNVKLGIVDDTENKEKLASLLRVRRPLMPCQLCCCSVLLHTLSSSVAAIGSCWTDTEAAVHACSTSQRSQGRC